MPRLARLDAPGLLHHIIIRGIERRAIFRDDFDRENFLERLSRLISETQTVCYAWVFMSNNAHFLLRSGSGGIVHLMRSADRPELRFRLIITTAGTVSPPEADLRLFQNRYPS